MDSSVIISFSAALLALALAVAVGVSAKTLAHWLFAAGMLLLGLESLFVGFTLNTLIPQEAAEWQQWRLAVLSLIPGIWFMFSLVYARENGRAMLSRLRLGCAAAVVVPVGIALLFWQQLVSAVADTEPGAPWVIILARGGILLNFCVLLGAILVLMNLERTYRSAVGTVRWRIKFMIIGLGVLFGIRAFASSQVVLFHSISVSLQILNSSALLLASLLVARTLLRTGHFEVGVYVSRSVLQGSLTVVFAGLYLVLLGIAAKITAPLGGDAAFQLKAFGILLALVLLAVLLLSDRVRLHIRLLISRHFERPAHDYRDVWRAFVQCTARCVDQPALCRSIATMVSEVFQALSVSVWLLDLQRPKLILAASTTVSTPEETQVQLEGEEAAEIIRALAGKKEPIDIDASRETWVDALRRCQPPEFSNGGNRLCAPLIAGGDLLGFMVVGDRVAGAKYGTQDFELLRTIADQAGTSLLNLQLSERLSEARQLEGFQTMSTFFVHDLKNTASTLSLMLKNFPVHYQNPEFREDALRGISKTVTHLNDLVERLNMLRHELQVHEVECDLNQVVTDALQDCGGPGAQIVKELGSLPKVRLDPAQVQKVVTNLVLNARDAVGEKGEVRIETSRRNGWVVLAVSDNGCGMSPEFVRNSLFRPFQSTKKKGLGIGMFHCKMIVDAHHGRMEVESQPGKGTRFQVLLPI